MAAIHVPCIYHHLKFKFKNKTTIPSVNRIYLLKLTNGTPELKSNKTKCRRKTSKENLQHTVTLTKGKMVIEVLLKFPHRKICIYSISKACVMPNHFSLRCNRDNEICNFNHSNAAMHTQHCLYGFKRFGGKKTPFLDLTFKWIIYICDYK